MIINLKEKKWNNLEEKNEILINGLVVFNDFSQILNRKSKYVMFSEYLY